jgi:uncharacterized RDD family membrane protein YckC
MQDIDHKLTYFLIYLLVSVLSWNYYRNRFYSAKDKYLTFGPRFWTGSIDSLILYPLFYVLVSLCTQDLAPAAYAALILAQSLILVVYNVVMHTKHGQTYGKMVCKVKVVDHATEGPISRNQAVLRESILILINCGCAAYQIYWILILRLTLA